MYAWFGVPVTMGFMVGGMGWEGTSPLAAWIGAALVVAAACAAGFAGGRLARVRSEASEHGETASAVR